MALISAQGISVGFGGPSLFENISLHIERGERICVVGRNGVGKSTLLQAIAGTLTPQSGLVQYEAGARVAFLRQDIPANPGRVSTLPEFQDVEGTIRVEAKQALSRLGVELDWDLSVCSGGERRRAYLAAALSHDWDLLLLDEPTNHLDIDAIEWLESYLVRATRNRSIAFVSHDRSFAAALATRVVALDRARLYSFPGTYEDFCRRRDVAIETEDRQARAFDKKLLEEERWLRRGIKARRTRNEGRVRRLLAMREEQLQRRASLGSSKLSIAQSERSGTIVSTIKDLSFAWGNPDGQQALISGFSTSVLAGDRIGIIGPNGSGKTTLLRLVLGELAPTSGTVKTGTGLKTAYFDQMKRGISGDVRLYDAIGDGYDTIEVGATTRHVLAYMRDFLFDEADRNRPIHTLSGGEQSRLVLARLFAVPSNVLVLDEPSNDLDQETLELLEDRLSEYQGTIFLVSHDRSFIDNVITSAWILDGSAQVIERVGNSADWLDTYRELRQQQTNPTTPKSKASVPAPRGRADRKDRPRKLSYKENVELTELPDRIDSLESEYQEISSQLANPELYRAAGGQERAVAMAQRLEELGAMIESAYARWGVLQEIAGE